MKKPKIRCLARVSQGMILLAAVSMPLYSPRVSYAQNQPPVAAATPDHKGLESAVAFSQFLAQWAVISIGGSIALAFSTSYWRPTTRKARLFYLLFIPAWGLLLTSLIMATRVQQNMQALVNLRYADETAIKMAINGHVYSQMWTMQLGLGFLCGWLLVFLLWWIFFDPIIVASDKPAATPSDGPAAVTVGKPVAAAIDKKVGPV